MNTYNKQKGEGCALLSHEEERQQPTENLQGRKPLVMKEVERLWKGETKAGAQCRHKGINHGS